MAQIIIHRVGNIIIVGPAVIKINGSHVVSLGTSETYTGDINPGPTILMAYSYIILGRYVLNFKAEAGKKYRFTVLPRGDSASTLDNDFVVTEARGSYQIGASN
jgi:hypothetical protein